MKAIELRLGNIVSINNKEQHPNLIGVPLRVTSIHPSIGLNGGITHGVCLEEVERKTNQFYGYWSQLIQFIEPIPITEELILKCGFVKAGGFYYTYNCSFTLNYDKFDDGSYNATSQCNNIARGIKHLHQLQNLYFALNGKELEIKL